MSSNPGLGDGVGEGKTKKVYEGFFQIPDIPNTLLVEGHLISRWRVETVPKGTGRIQRYRVINMTTREIVWVGRNIIVADRIRERLAGWQEAVHFPPKVDSE